MSTFPENASLKNLGALTLFVFTKRATLRRPQLAQTELCWMAMCCGCIWHARVASQLPMVAATGKFLPADTNPGGRAGAAAQGRSANTSLMASITPATRSLHLCFRIHLHQPLNPPLPLLSTTSSPYCPHIGIFLSNNTQGILQGLQVQHALRLMTHWQVT